ncbi:hypothetical protein ACFQY4_26490 [Catellatospora bangladeshensis]|uniref:Uncharacterized protein n=1 Tax=Catellatospora bangladeshensis TaxID=310355 RepID=A0A8J3NNB0_9ACTN|nr:hypothetical protein [Catellatospora bangladeshensis]GIF85888.1 hypothetical protein Cba03nite_72370 [Catellatospora bangladeshensis]
MGTSGAYGGSGSQTWDAAHEAYGDAAAADGTGPSDAQVQAFVNAFMQALAKNSGPVPGPSSYPLASLRPQRAGGGGGSSSSAGGGGERNLGRQTARGAAAVAGASALRTGDRATLAELGLDLNHLDSLPSPRAKCAYIVDTLLGAPSHPDEVALRAATLRTMVEIQKAKEALTAAQQLELFLQHLAYEQVLVELTSQRRTDHITPQRAKEIEDKAKKYLRASVSAMRLPKIAKLAAQTFVASATTLAHKVFTVFRIRDER